MSTYFHNTPKVCIAALAIALGSSTFLAPTEASAFALGGMGHSFGGMGGMGHGMSGLGRKMPTLSRGMGGSNLRSMSVGRSGGSTFGRTAHSESTGRVGNRADEGHGATDRNAGRGDTAAKDPRHGTDTTTGRTDARSDTVTKDASHGSDSDGRTAGTDDREQITHGRTVEHELNGRDWVMIPIAPGRTIYIPRQYYGDGGAYTPVQPNDVAVGNPCRDKVLLVETAKAECLNNIVTITGKKYYYCRTTKQSEVAPYSYPAVPKQECNGGGPVEGDWLPEGYTRPTSDEAGGCQDTGRTIIQYSPEGGVWMKITWHVYKCHNSKTGQDTMRLDHPDRSTDGTKASDDPPVQPGDTVVGKNL